MIPLTNTYDLLSRDIECVGWSSVYKRRSVKAQLYKEPRESPTSASQVFCPELHAPSESTQFMMGSTVWDSVLHLFRRACHQNPDNTAVDNRLKGKLSYRQLDQQSTKLAVRLQESGIEVGQVVPLLTSSRLEMVIAVLGILKAGGVYVPVDIDQWPPNRINYVLSRTNSGLVVYTGNELISQVDLPGNCRVIQVLLQSSASFEQINPGTVCEAT